MHRIGAQHSFALGGVKGHAGVKGPFGGGPQLSAHAMQSHQAKGYQTMLLRIKRRGNKLGIGLNDHNRVTQVGPAAEDGLFLYDWVVAYDGVDVGDRPLAELIASLPQLPMHELVVLRPLGSACA